MSTEQLSKKSSRPQLVKVDKAFKLAQLWVSNMTKSDESTTQVELESRPLRLGLGAAVPRHSQVDLSNDPVERNLQRKLNKRTNNTSRDEDAKVKGVDEESDEEENDSITTREFVKKRPISAASSLHPKKKQK